MKNSRIHYSIYVQFNSLNRHLRDEDNYVDIRMSRYYNVYHWKEFKHQDKETSSFQSPI